MLNRMVYQSAVGQIIAPRPAHILITTFDTWLPEQRSNAADDLIQQAIDRRDLPQESLVIRHLPVENTAASLPVCDYIDRFQPAVVLCCGMAEARSRLSLEQQAQLHGQTRQTTIDLAAWCDRLQVTEISHDAGQFVCNYLYYQVLERCALFEAPRSPRSESIAANTAIAPQAIFLHIPPLTPANRLPYAQDFATIIAACLEIGTQT